MKFINFALKPERQAALAKYTVRPHQQRGVAAAMKANSSGETGSHLTLRWRRMDSNFSYADAVNLVVALPVVHVRERG